MYLIKNMSDIFIHNNVIVRVDEIYPQFWILKLNNYVLYLHTCQFILYCNYILLRVYTLNILYNNNNTLCSRSYIAIINTW